MAKLKDELLRFMEAAIKVRQPKHKKEGPETEKPR